MKRFSLLLLFTIVCGTLIVNTGCTPAEEKIKKLFSKSLEECKKSKGTDFGVITKQDHTEIKLLRDACQMELKDVKLVDEFHAQAYTGPYKWEAGWHEEYAVWMLSGVTWSDLEKAKQVRDRKKDATAKDFERAEAHFAKAEPLLPDNAWLRRERLQNLLDLRKKTRKRKDSDVGIGVQATKYYEEHLAWAKDKHKPNALADAHVRVIAYLKAYEGTLDVALESVVNPSGDGHLERVIKEAKKTKNKKDLEKYSKELQKRREARVIDEKFLKDRQAKLKAVLCAQVAKLSLSNVTDEKLTDKIVGYKSSTKCM